MANMNKRIEGLDPRVLSSCTINSISQFEKFEKFMFKEPESQKMVFFGTHIDVARGNTQASKNIVESFPSHLYPESIVTRSNGWCDKGSYKSWNKCNINGQCFTECDDGLCHSQHKNEETRIGVPGQCVDWYVVLYISPTLLFEKKSIFLSSSCYKLNLLCMKILFMHSFLHTESLLPTTCLIQSEN
jgi:hypothetical protein